MKKQPPLNKDGVRVCCALAHHPDSLEFIRYSGGIWQNGQRYTTEETICSSCWKLITGLNRDNSTKSLNS